MAQSSSKLAYGSLLPVRGEGEAHLVDSYDAPVSVPSSSIPAMTLPVVIDEAGYDNQIFVILSERKVPAPRIPWLHTGLRPGCIDYRLGMYHNQISKRYPPRAHSKEGVYQSSAMIATGKIIMLQIVSCYFVTRGRSSIITSD